MKKILIFILVLWSVISYSQPTSVPGYNTFNEKRNQLALIARSLNIPIMATPALSSGQPGMAGAIIMDTTGGNKGIHAYWDGAWHRIVDSTWSGLIAASDLLTSPTFQPKFFDTLERKVIINGGDSTRDISFPTIERTATGKLVTGIASTRSHAFAGKNFFITSTNNGLNWSAGTYVQTDTNHNARNLVFSRLANDTMMRMWWEAWADRIYLQYSTDDLATWSTKDSITSALHLAFEEKTVRFLGQNVFSAYSFSPSAPETYFVYKNKIAGGTWTFLTVPNGNALQLTEGCNIAEQDTLFGLIRSELHPDSFYLCWTTDLVSVSTPIGVHLPESANGKPNVFRRSDGSWLANYRTSNSPPWGAYSISYDHGRTWTLLGYQYLGTQTYGSTIQAGDDMYMTVYGVQNFPTAPYGSIFMDYTWIPGRNSRKTNLNDEQPFGYNWATMNHFINRKDSTIAFRYGNGALNPVAISTSVDGGVNFIDNSTAAALAISHRSSSATFNINNSAAPTSWEQRLRLYDVTATGTDIIIDIGDATIPHFRMYQNGSIKTSSPFLINGSGGLRVEGGFSSPPTGSTGVGHEFFVAGGTAYWNPFNRTSSANAPANITASSLTLSTDVSIVGNVTSIAGLTASLPVQTNGSKGLISSAIDLSGSQVTGNLPVSHLNSGTSASASTFWRGDATWVKVAKTLNSNITTVGNVGAGEDDLMTYTIPAGQLATNGDFLEFEMSFAGASNGNNKAIKIYLAGTQILTVLNSTASSPAIMVRGIINRIDATTAAISITNNVNGGSVIVSVGSGSATWSGTVVLKATGEATSNNDIQQLQMIVKYWPN